MVREYFRLSRPISGCLLCCFLNSNWDNPKLKLFWASVPSIIIKNVECLSQKIHLCAFSDFPYVTRPRNIIFSDCRSSFPQSISPFTGISWSRLFSSGNYLSYFLFHPLKVCRIGFWCKCKMLACAFFLRSIFCFAYQQFVHGDNFLATLEALSNSSSSENDGHVQLLFRFVE